MPENKTVWKILVVDDEPDMVEILEEFLVEQEYEVYTALCGSDALAVLKKQKIDLLLSDINMPDMKGFELLRKVSKKFPHVKRALITAYDVVDYLQLARKYNIGNIITKTTPFNFDEFGRLIHNILSEDVFNLEYYIDGPIEQISIGHTSEIESAMKTVLSSITNDKCRRKFRHGLAELVINAVYYGSRQERGDQKEAWTTNVKLDKGEEVLVSWGQDKKKVAIAVTDQKGRLSKQDVLYWLERNTTRGENGQPLGFYDKHGKGLFITREINDRFIVNIKRNKITQIILLNYLRGQYDGHRPLWIHEF